jgi:acyl dehydratase
VTVDATDALREQLLERIGQRLGGSGPAVAPDPVNVPMIRHWVDAFEDRNPIYLDDHAAIAAGLDGIVAPPAMLQTWTMARPRIEGIRERGGSPDDIGPNSPLARLATDGYTATLATNSELEFVRYLRPGDHLESTGTLDDVSELKVTAVGVGYFITMVNTYSVGNEVVGRQRWRIFKFDPTRTAADLPPRPPRTPSNAAVVEKTPGPDLPPFDLDVTPTVVVAGAIASRDFMPVHHDRDYARAQGAPDLFMNILTTTGYVTRYVTDWAGPRAVVRRLAIRLGAPAVPGLVLRFTGSVTDRHESAGQARVEVTLRVANDLGDHATGTVALTLPADDRSLRVPASSRTRVEQ